MNFRVAAIEKGHLYNLAKSFRGPLQGFRLNTINAGSIICWLGYMKSESKQTIGYNRGFSLADNRTIVCADSSTEFYYLHTLEHPTNCGGFVVEPDQ